MENYNIGDWIYIINAESGAFGANNQIAQIIDCDNSECSGLSIGINVKIINTNHNWCLGINPEIRHLTDQELIDNNIKIKPRRKENLKYLIPLFESLNIK